MKLTANLQLQDIHETLSKTALPADPDYTGNAATVEAYIRESILEPEAYTVEGYSPLMPKTYAASLDEEELAALVDYLLTLK